MGDPPPVTEVEDQNHIRLLVSIRGGDMRLTLGSDLTIGFNWADAKKVHLFFTESFTFQIIEPKAYIPITRQAGQ